MRPTLPAPALSRLHYPQAAAVRAHVVLAHAQQHFHRAAAAGCGAAARRALEVEAEHRRLVGAAARARDDAPTKTIGSLLIARLFATLTFAAWAYLNRPAPEPPWPKRIQGSAFSPFPASEDPTHLEM